MKGERLKEVDTLLKKITTRFHKACADYGLIEDGDHILIGLSGGKDSLLLTELLGHRAQIYKPRFTVTALHVRVKERDYRGNGLYLCAFYGRRHYRNLRLRHSCGHGALYDQGLLCFQQ